MPKTMLFRAWLKVVFAADSRERSIRSGPEHRVASRLAGLDSRGLVVLIGALRALQAVSQLPKCNRQLRQPRLESRLLLSR